MGYSEDEIFAVLNESKQDRKRRQVLAKVTETVAAYRLGEMKDLQALEQLATWRRMNGFDRVADGEDSWFHGPRSLPPTPQEFTASLWSEVNALKDTISISARTRPWQKTMEFVEGIFRDQAAHGEAKSRGGTGDCHASQYSTVLYSSLTQSRNVARYMC